MQHEYEDKYLLAEFLANASIACHFSILEHLGVTGKPLEQVHSCLYSLFTIKTITYALLITLTSHFCSLSFIFLIFILFCYSLFYAYALCSIFSLLSLFISVLLYSFIPLFFYSFILVLSNISLVKRMGSKTKCNTQTNSWRKLQVLKKSSQRSRIRHKECTIPSLFHLPSFSFMQVTKAGIFGKFESFTVTKVHEYFWEYKIKWELLAFPGVDHAKAIVLQVCSLLYYLFYLYLILVPQWYNWAQDCDWNAFSQAWECGPQSCWCKHHLVASGTLLLRGLVAYSVEECG